MDLQVGTLSSADRHIVLDMATHYFPGHRCLLVFGSRIKHSATERSDVDVLVVLDDAAPCARRVFGHAGQRFDTISAGMQALQRKVTHGARANQLSLARCIAESVCLPEENADARALRACAAAALAAGSRLQRPHAVRIMLTRAVAQLHKVDGQDGAMLPGLELLCMLRETVLIELGTGKTDAYYGDQVLQARTPRLRQSMLAAASALCIERNAQPLLQLTRHVLDRLGGPVNEGYSSYPPEHPA